MRERLQRGIMIATVVALALFVPACTRQDTGATVERIVAVGDVHGDFDQFVRVLRAAEVIDAEHRWIGGKTHLVQTGDVLDRGPDSRKVMDLLMRLELQASRAGGAVHALIGNHETMVPRGDWRYVHPGEVESFGGTEQFRKAMSAEGKYGKWIRSHDAVVKINDVLFLHGGLRAEYADMSLEEINATIRTELSEGITGGIVTDSSGPLWDRYLAMADEEAVAEELETVLKAYGASRMVVAHTVWPKGIIPRAGGRLIRIDVGLSQHYGGPAACLVIEKGVLYEVRHPNIKRKLDLPIPATSPASERPPAAVLPHSLAPCRRRNAA